MKAINIFLLTLLGVFIFTSCEKNPDLSDLDGKNTVVTNYKKDAKFKQANYYISDSILIIGGGQAGTQQPQYWTIGNPNADKIFAQVTQNMADRGYTKVADGSSSAGLAIHLTYIKDIYYYASYMPYWWDWWGSSWWYGWYPYYPYPVVYTYTTGSLIMDMVDLSTPSETQKTVIWDTYMTGLLSGDQQYDSNLTLQAIDQAFAQSPYVSNK